jgi:hypothetical protein
VDCEGRGDRKWRADGWGRHGCGAETQRPFREGRRPGERGGGFHPWWWWWAQRLWRAVINSPAARARAGRRIRGAGGRDHAVTDWWWWWTGREEEEEAAAVNPDRFLPRRGRVDIVGVFWIRLNLKGCWCGPHPSILKLSCCPLLFKGRAHTTAKSERNG